MDKRTDRKEAEHRMLIWQAQRQKNNRSSPSTPFWRCGMKASACRIILNRIPLVHRLKGTTGSFAIPLPKRQELAKRHRHHLKGTQNAKRRIPPQGPHELNVFPHLLTSVTMNPHKRKRSVTSPLTRNGRNSRRDDSYGF